MKVEMVNPFITATINVFDTMAGLCVSKKEIYVKQEIAAGNDISGIIGIAGNLTGFVAMSFPESVALKITAAFLGEDKNTLDDDVIDTIGEVINMVVGSAKTTFAKQGMKYDLGLPSVVTGKDHTVNKPKDIMCIGVNFNLDGEVFSIEVGLK